MVLWTLKLFMPSQANTQEVSNDPLLKFKGKTIMVLPPFLMKTLMDADSKDPCKLFKAACKALNNYNESQSAIVPPT
jgi:hypothetical protein